jgi:hypothetical protein
LGVTGAITGLLIALMTLILMFTNSGYQLGLLGWLIIFALSALYFKLRGQLLNGNAPEELFANTLKLNSATQDNINNDLYGEAA